MLRGNSFTNKFKCMKNYKLLSTLAIASIVLLAGCKKDDYVETIGVCPVVISTDPANAANSIPYNKVITATFNEKMNGATITGASFIVQQGTTNIAGTVTAVDATASFTPTSPLLPFTVYKGTIKTTVKDLMGNALQKDYVWTFTTMAQITLIANPIIGGITSGGGAYAMGATVTVTATPNVGYVFVSWTENGTVVSPVIAAQSGNNVISGKEVSTSSSYQFTMTGNRTLTANFAVIVLGNFAINLSSNPPAGGTTNGNGTFVENSVKTVSATANTGYTFTNWTEGGIIVSTNSTFILPPLTTNRTLVANFLINSYNLTVSGVNGTVAKNPNQTSFNYGTSVILTPTPNTGYTFTSWSGDATGNANPLTVNMVTDKTITANFTIAAYTLVVVSTNGVVVANPVQATYNYGSTVQLTATPNAGYTFTSWSGDATGSTNPLTVTMNSNKNITANYTANTYTLTVISLNGTVVKNIDLVSYINGASVILTSTPNTGYTFTSWTGDATGTSNPLTVIMNSNKTITANYTAIIPVFTLNVTAVNGLVVKIPDLANYTSGTSVLLNATPNSGYVFSEWTGDVTGSISSTTVIMNSNKNVTANFTAIPNYTLNVTAVNGTVVKNPNLASYVSGASVILTATPNSGYIFTGWSGDVTGSVSPVTVVMNSNKNVTANFTAIASNYTLNVTAVNGTVVKNPDLVSYASGASVMLTATANSGYTFTGWSGDATGSVSPVTVVMNSNKNVTANFTITVIPPSGPALIDLGCAAPFAALAGSTITSTGPSIITGNVGLSAGTALVGFPPGIINGTQEITTPTAASAKICLTSAFLDGQGRSLNVISLPGNLGGLTLAPGLYHNSISSGISGTGANGILTLDAQGNANAVWIFQLGSTLTTDPATSIVLAGGAQAKNIFWIVGTSATLGTTSVFYGNILAQASITLNTGAVLNGRALTQVAAVSLDASTITKPQ